jgi:CRP-like cAMP-binding protein
MYLGALCVQRHPAQEAWVEWRRISALRDTSAERVRLLSLVDIFEPLTEEEIESLNDQLPDPCLQSGEIFFGPQDRSERIFLLQSGRVRIFRSTSDGR